MDKGQSPAAAPQLNWRDRAVPAKDIQVSAERGAVQFSGRRALDLTETTVEVPLSAVLQIASVYLATESARLNQPRAVVPS